MAKKFDSTSAVAEPPANAAPSTPPEPAPEPPPPAPEDASSPSGPAPLAAAPPGYPALVTPSQLSTHFFGPIVSGNKSLGTDGLTALAKRWDLDFSKGAAPASIVVNLPPNTLLIDFRQIVWLALNNPVTLVIGTTPGGADLLASVTISTVGNPAPVPILPVNPPPSKIYLTLTLTTPPTVGKCSLILDYLRM